MGQRQTVDALEELLDATELELYWAGRMSEAVELEAVMSQIPTENLQEVLAPGPQNLNMQSHLSDIPEV